MRSITFSVLVALLIAVPCFAQAASSNELPSIQLPNDLDRVLRDYEKAWRAKDAAALAQLFTEDGFVLSNGKPAVRGRAAIQAAYADGGGPLFLRAYAYSVDGTVGYIIGGYSGASEGAAEGKFVLALRRNDKGRWLIAADMDNTNRRSRPAAQ
jgi:ketosteroid isomerase-like protein